MTQIFIYKNVKNVDIVDKSIRDNIEKIYINDKKDTIDYFDKDKNVTRIGFMWDNNYLNIPFGSTKLKIDNYTFSYFKKELFDYLSKYNNITIDLITCNIKNKKFIYEINKINETLDINIQYSINSTGNVLNSDWIMESDNVSIKDIYFNDNINEYTDILGMTFFNSATIDQDGHVWAFGNNDFGQLGNGTTTSSNIPVKVLNADGSAFKGAFQVDFGFSFMIILKKDGTVWSCGEEDDNMLDGAGLLGNPNAGGQSLYPIQVVTGYSIPSEFGNDYDTDYEPIGDVKQISCGWAHTLLLKNDGSVWTFGSNDIIQLGIGDNVDYVPFAVPVRNSNDQEDHLTNVKYISANFVHNLIIKNDGSLWGYGLNFSGQLGTSLYGIDEEIIYPTQVLKDDDTFFTNALIVDAGLSMTMIIDTNNNLWFIGAIAYESIDMFFEDGPFESAELFSSKAMQMTFDNNIMDVSTGISHVLIILKNGSLMGAFNNIEGQLGSSSDNFIDDFTPILSGKKIVAIGTGLSHSVVLTSNGVAYLFGDNEYGQIGVGEENNNISIPTTLNIGRRMINVFNSNKIHDYFKPSQIMEMVSWFEFS
jgi:alpha-tubulin suppressor-like RCC1 family protein